MKKTTINDLIKDHPFLHRSKRGEERYFGISDILLRFIDECVSEGSRTIETGAGMSTLAFAIKRCTHFAIAPDAHLWETIRIYAENANIAVTKVNFVTGYSQDILPCFEEDGFDVALIDGDHGFPLPFIDWFYLAPKLKVGGLLIIDDIQIWTGRTLKQFLSCEPDWHPERDLLPRTAVFRKLKPFKVKGWLEQNYTVLNSDLAPNHIKMLPRHLRAVLFPDE